MATRHSLTKSTRSDSSSSQAVKPVCPLTEARQPAAIGPQKALWSFADISVSDPGITAAPPRIPATQEGGNGTDGHALQAKLSINQPGDEFEQDAERVADEVMRLSPSGAGGRPRIQRMFRQGGQTEDVRTVSAKNSDVEQQSSPSPETKASVSSLDTGGEPLQPALRSFFEPRFGHSFEHVRVHVEPAAAASARDLDALAYTKGRHIVFAPGQFQPQSDYGRRLLAHELTHVVQQGWASEEHIQRSYVVPTPETTEHKEIPHPKLVSTSQLDDAAQGAQIIQRAPDPDTSAASAPTLKLTPGDTILRGDTLTASVDFTPTAGEKLNVTGWRYTTAAGDTVDRRAGEPKFQKEWQGVMALSGRIELSYTLKPKGGPTSAGPPVTAPVTVNARSGPDWETTITDSPETPLGGQPSPPQAAGQLGVHNESHSERFASRTEIASGPNAKFTFVAAMPDRQYISAPQIHPDVSNAASPFRVFHENRGRLYFVSNAGGRTLIPAAEYRILTASGTQGITFSVPNWAAFYKKYGVLTVTCTGGGRRIVAHNDWWTLDPDQEAPMVKITNPGAIHTALGIGAKDDFTPTTQVNGRWNKIALMPSAQIEPGTKSHEYLHPTHSHRANLHKILRALDPRRIMEESVSTPTNSIDFPGKLDSVRDEIRKPVHELVDEAASKTAGRFVAVPGKTMAAVNQDPATAASLGVIWDITNDRPLGNETP